MNQKYIMMVVEKNLARVNRGGNSIFVTLLLVCLFGCNTSTSEQASHHAISDVNIIGYWDVADGRQLSFYLGGNERCEVMKAYYKNTGKYRYCHLFRKNGMMIEMEYVQMKDTLVRRPVYNSEIANEYYWGLLNGKLVMLNDTFEIKKYSKDSLYLVSERNSVLYVKSKQSAIDDWSTLRHQ